MLRLQIQADAAARDTIASLIELAAKFLRKVECVRQISFANTIAVHRVGASWLRALIINCKDVGRAHILPPL
ncbi:MAG: hypothetical protein ABR526_08490 [Chthoniobacterales bacterium]